MNQAQTHPAPTAGPLDVESVRSDFPTLHQTVNGRPLVYLDSGASAQKPELVIDAMQAYERQDLSLIHI